MIAIFFAYIQLYLGKCTESILDTQVTLFTLFTHFNISCVVFVDRHSVFTVTLSVTATLENRHLIRGLVFHQYRVKISSLITERIMTMLPTADVIHFVKMTT